MRNRESDTLYFRAPRLNQFNILRLLAAESRTTQAELARRCGLSVAMVNNYMKDLCGAGFLEYRRKSSRTVTYHITTAGRMQLEGLRHELIDEMVRLFGEAKEQVRDHILSLAPDPMRQVVLLGSGNLAEIALHALQNAGVQVLGLFDDKAVGRECCGYEMLDVARLKDLQPDAILVADCTATPAVRDCLRLFELRGVRIVCIDADLAGVRPPFAVTPPVLAAANA